MQITIRPRYNPDYSIYQNVILSPPEGWESLIERYKEELFDISNQLDREVMNNGPYYPPKKYIFRALELVKPKDVRVVILGMDPYPGEYNGQCYANGLAFSVDRNIPIAKIPHSLRNIFKEVKSNYPNVAINHGDLTSWACQGVLLINASLTVRPGTPGSHKKLWIAFIKGIIQEVKDNEGIVFVFWGKDAQNFVGEVGVKPQKLISAHPSNKSARLFFGNQHFAKINNYFRYIGKDEIDWSVI